MAAAAEYVFGIHAVEAALAEGAGRCRVLWVQEGASKARLGRLMDEARAAGIKVEGVPRRVLDELVDGARHQGVVAEVQARGAADEAGLSDMLDRLGEPALLLVLDGVQDPHNLGACLRSADAAGVHGVIIPKDRAAGLTAVVRKVACGAAETVPVFAVTNLARTLRNLKDSGVWLYGAAGEAQQTIYELDLKGPVALVLGSEGKGLRRLTREHCDALARIPMVGQVESLNVSVAAGVLLFEARRQRLAGGN
ncbi:MAG: 23S rRNA (guanosine(2251)-2'-O)-methyltransferase RlmB [Gammaproteobacteria bacterium]